MESLLIKILQEQGPCLSGEVVRILTSKYHISPAAARQQIARRPAVIKSLSDLPFARNAQFLYHQNDYGSRLFWTALVKAFESSKSSYGAALGALIIRGGIMPKDHFFIACGSPWNLSRHPSPQVILNRLIGVGLLEERAVEGFGVCVAFAKHADAYFDQPIADMRARLLVEDVLLNALKDWARKLALGSFNSFAIRSDGQMPQVGTFGWDLAAPSYLAPLRSGKSASGGIRPGFLVCDLLLGQPQTEVGLLPFLRKVETLTSLPRMGRCLYLYVAEGYSAPAFRAARSAGIMPATPESLFGKEVAEALVELAKVIKQAALVVPDPAKLDRLFRQLGKIEGAANSLRGALFEFVVADLVRKAWGANPVLNYRVRAAGQDVAEIDVVAPVSGQRIYFIECKGQAPSQTVDDDEVAKWLTVRIPAVRKFALAHPDWRTLEMHFELWTSGQISPISVARIQRAQSATKKYSIQYRSGSEVGDLADGTGDLTLRNVIRTHFLNHPLATEEIQVSAMTLPALTGTGLVTAGYFDGVVKPSLPLPVDS